MIDDLINVKAIFSYHAQRWYAMVPPLFLWLTTIRECWPGFYLNQFG
jgi:hypothetical protein